MRRAGAALLLCGLAAVAVRAQTPAPEPATSPTPNPYTILARVKAGLRAVDRPPFVVYTIVRHDTIDGVPDMQNSYALRIWCRTSDSAALARHVFAGRTVGPAEFIEPVFDKPIDPGPPTADLLDVIRQTQGTSPTPAPAPTGSSAPVIGSVSVVIETNYRVTYGGVDGSDDHLVLEARRDPDRNRLTDLYVDRYKYTIHRAVAHDHLYSDGRVIPQRFEIDFGTLHGVPVIIAIHGQTDFAAPENRDAGLPLNEVKYRFEDVSFPAQLPDWYFDPAQYGTHRGDYPE